MGDSTHPLLTVRLSCQTRLWDAVRDASARVAQVAGFEPEAAQSIGEAVNDTAQRIAGQAAEDRRLEIAYSMDDGMLAIETTTDDPLAPEADAAWLRRASDVMDRVECRRENGRAVCRLVRALPR